MVITGPAKRIHDAVYGQEYAILGAGIATVVSRLFYLGALAIETKKSISLKSERTFLIKPLVASLIMAGFLYSFNSFVDMNLILGAIEIVLGASIYFLALWGLKGIEKEDLDLFKKIFFKKRK